MPEVPTRYLNLDQHVHAQRLLIVVALQCMLLFGGWTAAVHDCHHYDHDKCAICAFSAATAENIELYLWTFDDAPVFIPLVYDQYRLSSDSLLTFSSRAPPAL